MKENILSVKELKLSSRFWISSSMYLLFFSTMLYSCSNNEEPTPREESPERFIMTQQALDAAVFVIEARDTSFTGNPFGARELDAQGNIRSIFSSATKSQVQQVGHISVIWSYTNVNGRRAIPLFADVMVKREPGFNPAGNDFEYMRIPYDSTVDYGEHPNGMLPEDTNTTLRGSGLSILSVNCVSCHRTTPDFVFYN